MSRNTYDLGQLVSATAAFRNRGGSLADPSTVVFQVRPPGTSIATHVYGVTPSQVVRDATGIYHLDIDSGLEGEWAVRAVGTGALQAADRRFYFIEGGL